ncbi:hypothetical protein AB7W88_11340 [Providencia vermicola]|uniref:hypothetical protein n=1 Tax=Providencia TaxID=586 RepID=UPI0012B5F261|nr:MULTISPECIES: hypothetical protein [Providencia]MTB38696.1 hypothetical protein [Providencia sp. wls1949]MTC08563.1 hypothetical protein [Providencia sp. wls1948]QIC14702.1 hypothetical protein G3341_02815 [Providencia vermicola]WBA56560.1 hypothetical protein O7C57_17330 [Providencia sp. 21OH12SH02B-Prov]
MKYFYLVFYTLFISFSSMATQYEENNYFPSNDVTSAMKMNELSGKLNFKISLMYSPCVILANEYVGSFFFIELDKCLFNDNNIKIPLQAKAKVLEGNQQVMAPQTLFSGRNNVYLQTKNIKGRAVIMELDYD